MNDDDFPLYRRFPALRRIPRVRLCTLPSPVQLVRPGLWIKRDDLNSESCGGNKVRALEFLLGPVRRGDTVLTVGGAGSTHVLTTMLHGTRVGAQVIAERWRHDMNPTADAVNTAIARFGAARVRRTAVGALGRALVTRATHRVHYIPTGGRTPLGTLGHVNAALELVDQIESGELTKPAVVVVPFGSGGTTAGLALGFAIARARIPILAARVAPRIAAGRHRLRSLIRRTARLIESYADEPVPDVMADAVIIASDVFGGAYGRALPAAAPLADWLAAETGIALDGTYSAKAFVAADAVSREKQPTLFWLTFDPRCLHTETR